ncbi:MAG: tripartite tricarboxylate transporter substrate binding protein [Pseudomonadota bacterium]
MKALKHIVVILAGILLAPAWAVADYPERPIKVIFPNQAGSPYHQIVLGVLSLVEDDIPQPVGVQAMPGAGTSAGTRFVLAQPADGYTMLFIHDAVLQTAKFGMLGTGIESLEALAQVNRSQPALYALADAPYNDLNELVEYANANPGEVKVGINTGAASHLEMVGLKDALGADLKFVHVGGGGTGFRQGLLAGDVNLIHTNPGGAIEELERQGMVKALAYYGEERHAQLQDVATMDEQGFETPIVMQLYGYFWIRSDTPEDIKQYWRDTLAGALTDPDNVAQLQEMFGVDIVHKGGDELQQLVADRYNARASFIDEYEIEVK